MTTEQFPPGAPRWFTLGAEDQERAAEFYRSVFGWTVADTHGGTHFMLGSRPVASVRPVGDDSPAGWVPWLEVVDVDDALDRAKAFGATLVRRTPDGRGALVADPGGAVFGMGSPPNTSAEHVFGETDSVFWIEAKVEDHCPDVALFSDLFDYEFLAPKGPGKVEVFRIDGRGYGGVMSFDERWDGHREPHWLLYMDVESVDAMVERATAAGGSVWFAPFDTPIGRIAYLRDTEGNPFAVTQKFAPPA
ncbi:hypothetical protein BJF84_21595 [Rhodococcus sp. CUA-806]|mgnify:CR=1 FL=1|jgi:predicted enzyme related to lactoylglutathione lyase|nr:hypothetical protein BJF84_21595 [Rhodococcus sp. CUA-806]